MYGLSSGEHREMLAILGRHAASISAAWLFGSRARGDYKRTSDLDLAVSFRQPAYSALADEFFRSRIPYTVDIVDSKANANDALRKNIAQEGKLVFLSKGGRSVMTAEHLRAKWEDYCRAVGKLDAAMGKDIAADDMYLDATMQRFEFSFELAWKLMKACLEYEGIEASSPRTSIREGFKAGLVPDAAPWLDMLDKRNLSSHTYDEAAAREIYRHIQETYLGLLALLRDEVKARLSEEWPGMPEK